MWSPLTLALLIVIQRHALASAGLDLLLQLARCNNNDSDQIWHGPALNSAPFHVRTQGSPLCISHLTEQPAGIVGLSAIACQSNHSQFVLTRTGQLQSLWTGLCLEAPYEDGTPGVYFQLSGCYNEDDPLILDQRWLPNISTGLIESARLAGRCVRADRFELPTLPIQPGAVVSHGFGDMNIAFHFAHSAGLAGVCGHDSQPYHCAVHYFAGEALVPQTPESSVPFCDGCPPNKTVLYDHCKNHPEWVDVGQLPDYARGNNKIDSVANIYNSTIYLSRAVVTQAALKSSHTLHLFTHGCCV